MMSIPKQLQLREFEKEFDFYTARSSGPGGQHVNKTETKVELRFHVDNSSLLTEEEKKLIQQKLKRKINQDGYLIISAQEYRSQWRNKELTIKRFYKDISHALKRVKKRIPTRPSQQSVEKRITRKKQKGQKKELRLRPRLPIQHD